MTIEEVLQLEESQTFERKSIHISPKALAVTLIAFANADGGTVAIGISDKTKTIEGVDREQSKLNDLLRVPFDFCEPTVPVHVEKIACIDSQNKSNHIIVMRVEQSSSVHANQADEAYLRVGDKSKKLTFEERTQLLYDKGEQLYEDRTVTGACLEDIDLDFVQDHIKKIGYNKTHIEYLKENNGYVTEKNGKVCISVAAMLLFGKKPQQFLPRARIRFIKYEGIEEKFGSQMNVIKDVVFEGKLLDMINSAVAYLDTQIKEKTYLGKDGLFVKEEEYPRFVRQELIVNAVTHRSYAITGTEIQIKMFDDRIVVESPGKFPGLVNAKNIRYTHFSRNPKIAEFLKAYNFVKEFGEGVDRIFTELAAINLGAPLFHSNDFLLQIVVSNKNLSIDPKNLSIDPKNLSIDPENLSFGDRNLSIDPENLSIEKFQERIAKMKYKEQTQKNLLRLYENIGYRQVFGTSEIVDILNCSSTAAKTIVGKLKEMSCIVPVKGQGKGKYLFQNAINKET